MLFQPLNPRRIYEGKNRNKCMPEIQGENVYPPGNWKTLTLPGHPPAVMATAIGIGATSLFAAILSSVLVNPAQRISFWGWGREGGETPSCRRISSKPIEYQQSE
jgi:hypothetical protein